jgi:hypothetical protein
VVTHLTTNPPVHCLYMAERTGSLIFSVLWSYVEKRLVSDEYIVGLCTYVEVQRTIRPLHLFASSTGKARLVLAGVEVTRDGRV